ncbi:hypothetical protein Bbelb_142940 [Branchiostoma belcheri]|nr:hypothetical protein Bbelb_142940 [Branchiostoma belcheri]
MSQPQREALSTGVYQAKESGKARGNNNYGTVPDMTGDTETMYVTAGQRSPEQHGQGYYQDLDLSNDSGAVYRGTEQFYQQARNQGQNLDLDEDTEFPASPELTEDDKDDHRNQGHSNARARMDTNDTESEEKDAEDDPKDHTYNNPENHTRNNPKNETHNNPKGGPEHPAYSQGTKEDHTYNNIPDPTDESTPSRPGDQQKRVRRLIPNIIYEDSAQHEDSSRRNSVEDDNNDDDSERRSSLGRLQHAVKNSRVLLVFTTTLITTVVVTAVFLTFPPKATQLQSSPPYSFPGSITVSSTTHRDCASAWLAGNRTTGVYTITPRDGERPLKVLCDMDTAGGGWTVFQRRFDGSVSFDKPWRDYRDGFGDVRGEFWLGLEAVHQIVSRETHDMRIVLGDFEGREAYADYSNFSTDTVHSSPECIVNEPRGLRK